MRLELLGRSVEIGEEERARLAGELHDHAIQLLTAAGVRLQLAVELDDPVHVERAKGLVDGGARHCAG